MPEAKRMRDKRLIDMRTGIGGKTEVDVIMMLKPHHSWIAGYIYTLSEGERREGVRSDSVDRCLKMKRVTAGQ